MCNYYLDSPVITTTTMSTRRQQQQQHVHCAWDHHGRLCVHNAYAVKDALKTRQFRWDMMKKVWYRAPPITAELKTWLRTELNLTCPKQSQQQIITSAIIKPYLSIQDVAYRINDHMLKAFPKPYQIRGEILSARTRQQRVYVDVVDHGQQLTCCLDNDDEDKAFEVGAYVVTNLTRAPQLWRNGRVALMGCARDSTIERSVAGQEAQRRKETWDALVKEKLDRRNKEGTRLSRFPRHIVLITAEGSRAHHDFLHELRKDAAVAFTVSVVDVCVQGSRMTESVVAAFDDIAAVSIGGGADVVVLTRGGGSQQDLQGFDSDAVVRAVAMCPLPVITAIGHHDDESLCDRVAFHHIKTPTAAADYLVKHVTLLRDQQRNRWARTLLMVQQHFAVKHTTHQSTRLPRWQRQCRSAFKAVKQHLRHLSDAMERYAMRHHTVHVAKRHQQWQRFREVSRTLLVQRREGMESVVHRFETWKRTDHGGVVRCIFVDAQGKVIRDVETWRRQHRTAPLDVHVLSTNCHFSVVDRSAP